MLTQVEFADIAGKTVAKAATNCFGDAALSFTDGTFAMLSAVIDHEEACLEEPSFTPVCNSTQRLAVDCGIATEEEIREAARPYNEEVRLRKERHDRAEYERLKAKYEPAKGG